MHRSPLLKTLSEYRSLYPEEEELIQRFESFVQTTPACFERSNEAGHITGSAFILSPDHSAILLTLHAKLNLWLQLGGHADGCPHVEEVAFREAIEESGLTRLQFYPNAVPFDLEIHEIPAYKEVKAHLHYDVRFLLLSEEEAFVCSEESLALRWVPLDRLASFCHEENLLRAAKKIQRILQREMQERV